MSTERRQGLAVRLRGFAYRHSLGTVAVYLFVTLFLIVVLFPVAWMVRISITPRSELFTLPPRWFFDSINTTGYQNLGEQLGFFVYFANSVVVALGTVLFCLVAGTLAGYSFSRFDYPGRQALMIFTLSAQMFPWALLIISIYLLFRWSGLLDTRMGLIIAHTTFALPLTIWIIKGYFDTIPHQLEESAFLDGCGRMEALWRIILPLTSPGLTAAAVYVFIFSWNDFLFGLTLTTRDSQRTLAPGIAMSFIGEFQFRWVEMMAASVVITIPVVILFLFLQRSFVEGLTSGALKD